MREHFMRSHCRKRGPLAWIGMGLVGLVGLVVLSLLLGYFVMLLWNHLMPGLFGLKTLMYWQAVGLIILGKLIFGPFFPPPGRQKHFHYGPECEDGSDWKAKGGWGKWRYYDEYWKQEGRAAFEKYVEEREKSGNAPGQEKKD